MIIVNSKDLSYVQNGFNQNKYHSKKQMQYDSVNQIQLEEEESIIEWIKQNYADDYSNCGKVNQIQDLYNGMTVAEIVSHYLENQYEKDKFLNQIQVISRVETQHQLETAKHNLNCSIKMLRSLFQKTLQLQQKVRIELKDKNINENIMMIKMGVKSLLNLKAEKLIGNKNTFRNFMILVIMILPSLKEMNLIDKHSNPSNFKSRLLNKQQHGNHIQNIQELSSIMMPFQSIQTVSKYPSRISNYSSKKENNQNKYDLQKKKSSSIRKNSIGPKYSTYDQQNYYNTQCRPFNEQNQEKFQNQKPTQQTKHKINNISMKKQQCQQTNQHHQQSVNKQLLKNLQIQQAFEQKVQKFINWIQDQFHIDVSCLKEPHLLLGQLVNIIFAPNSRVNDNQKPIKPSHYLLGSYSVYKKVISILIQVQRLSKNNLIKLMNEVEQGQVKQDTFWCLIQDLYLMIKNKISERMFNNFPCNTNKKTNERRKTTLGSQKFTTQNDQNQNFDNINNQSVTNILKNAQVINKKKQKLKEHTLYDENIIKQTQLWLQQEMGMSHSLKKSKFISPQFNQKPSTINNIKNQILENPLLNGTMYAKILQRLKIGNAKGITTPLQTKQLKLNIEIITNQLLKRGYECGRKFSLYKPTYNLYIGILSQIRQIYMSKQQNAKQMIQNDRQKKIIQETIYQLAKQECQELENWLNTEYNQKIEQINNIKCLKLNQLKSVIQSIINVNFLKQTTSKIKHSNYQKLITFFISIGFTHYSTIKVQDFILDDADKIKKTQKIRWLILRDLRIIKGEDKSGNNLVQKFTTR